jgi:hypothetical protein
VVRTATTVIAKTTELNQTRRVAEKRMILRYQRRSAASNRHSTPWKICRRDRRFLRLLSAWPELRVPLLGFVAVSFEIGDLCTLRACDPARPQ